MGSWAADVNDGTESIDEFGQVTYRAAMNAEILDVSEAKARWSELLERAALGEDIVIAQAGRPVARLVQWVAETEERTPGIWAGRVRISEDFDAFSEQDDLEWCGSSQCDS